MNNNKTESAMKKADETEQISTKKVDAATRLIMLTAANSMLAQYRNDNTSIQVNRRFRPPCSGSKQNTTTDASLQWSTVYSNSNVKSGTSRKSLAQH